MIIINKISGQMCNQLFLFAHLLAHGAASGQRVWFPGFRKNESYFEYFSDDRVSYSRNIFLPFSADWSKEFAEFGLRRFFHKDGKLLRLIETVTRKKFHVSLETLTEFMFPEMEGGGQLTLPVCFFEGWVFRTPSAFTVFAPQLRNIFRFRNEDISHSKAFIKSLPLKTIIGVHIRQSDYSTDAPQWHYSPLQYHKWMTELYNELGAQVCFVVVSDGKLPQFDEPWITIHRGNAVQDLCVLSHSQMIMGPPSTFNRWAAFMGEKPHLCLWNESQQVKHQDFLPFKMHSNAQLTSQDVETLKWFGIV